MVRILFTGVGRRVELVQAFREAALALGKELVVYGADSDLTAPALVHCDVARWVKPITDVAYVSELLDMCKRERIDLVIPTIDSDLLCLAESKERFARLGTRILVSSPDLVQRCWDKSLTTELFTGCGLNAPARVCDWRKYSSGFPAFIKPRKGSSAIDAYVARDMQELECLAKRVGDYVVQPFVAGREYSVDVLCDWDGRPLCVVPRERLRVRAGEVSKARICMDDAIIRDVKRLCAEIRPCGPLTVQLIRDEQGVDWYIEINPRFGGGAPISMRAGADIAESVLGLISDEPVQRFTHVADGAVYSRFDQTVCVSVATGPVRGVVFDLDDTLYPEKDYVRSGFRAVSEHLGGGYEGALWSYFEKGLPAIDELLRALGREDEASDALQAYRGHRPQIQLRSGAREMLVRLRNRGIKVGIITDGRPEGQRNKLEALGLYELVDDVVITDELGGPQFRKPCDIAFRIMRRRWGIPSSQMVYVGDNLSKDFLAPRQLGMGCVYLRDADGLYYDGTAPFDFGETVSDFFELGEVLDEWTRSSR